MNGIELFYDVAVIGGGPAGSTLAAILARDTDLSVAVFDRETFPREHIGESLNHTALPSLEYSGALAKVLASDCWVKKYGGVFAWDPDSPMVGFFEQANLERSGVYRWSMHVDRPRFDHLLLDHAETAGAAVFQGVRIKNVHVDEDTTRLQIDDDHEVRCRFVVDASGRHRCLVRPQGRQLLSKYRNIAVWQHYLGCVPAHQLSGDWNNLARYRAEKLSPIACIAFDDGWCWYIPVRKIVDGEAVVTHSIGVVTDPEVLQHNDYTDPDFFLRKVKSIPLLGELIAEARPVRDKMLTATNYSMIQDKFCDFDERWILAGDAAYFVDPLFSSGVGFSMAHASSAALLIKSRVDNTLSDREKRDLWDDYDRGWHGTAESFAAMIDKWYRAIGDNRPDSVYWNSDRVPDEGGVVTNLTFEGLLNTAFSPDALYFMSALATVSEKPATGYVQFASMLGQLGPGEPDDDDLISIVKGVDISAGVTLEVPGFKGVTPPLPYQASPSTLEGADRYWADPVNHGAAVSSPHAKPANCHRFRFGHGSGECAVHRADRHGPMDLWLNLRDRAMPYAELKSGMTSEQQVFFAELVNKGMVRVERDG